MKKKNLTRMVIAAGAAVACAGASHTSAQSVDALLDKLVDKGVLSVSEANDLKEESDKGFTSAYSVKSGMPDWVTSLKFNGDMRARYESFSSGGEFVGNGRTNSADRARFRYRFRFGATAVLKDNLEVGFRLSSSESASGGSGGDPISGNTTVQDNGSKKLIFIDLAYGKWTPLNTANWAGSLIVGKMENPLVFSDMVFDADYTPEGAAIQLGYTLNDKHTVKLNGGAFVLDEIGNESQDPYLLGAQLRLDSAWTKNVSTTAGLAALVIMNEDALANSITNGTSVTSNPVPNQNRGNTRVNRPTSEIGGLGGALAEHFYPLVGDLAFTYSLEKVWGYNGAFPIRVGGDYMYNLGASDNNVGYSVGVMFGKSGKKGLWDLSYRYKYLEGDAWYEELVDSDFGALYRTAPSGGSAGYGAGTNVRGHILRASYSPYDSLTLAVTGFFTDLIDENPAGSKSDMTRLQVDASLKF
jgi:hypothetical protein